MRGHLGARDPEEQAFQMHVLHRPTARTALNEMREMFFFFEVTRGRSNLQGLNLRDRNGTWASAVRVLALLNTAKCQDVFSESPLRAYRTLSERQSNGKFREILPFLKALTVILS